MMITSKVDAVDAWICSADMPMGYDNSQPLQEKEVLLQGQAISSLRSFQVCGGGLFIINTKMTFTQQVQDHLKVTGESIMLAFCLEGDASATFQGFGKKSPCRPNAHHICYTPQLEAVYTLQPATRHHYFLVILSKEFYFRLLHRHNSPHQEFTAQLLQGRHTWLSSKPLHITAEMKWVIQDICNCQHSATLKRLYIEAKVAELLVLQLEQWQQWQQPRRPMLRGDDELRIAEAKAILEENFAKPPTIQELARLVCINEHNLKQGFKYCYNHTVHGYVVWLRMQQARHLLRQSQQRIGEIAYAVGYKKAAHFTAAFKKHYGFLPSEIKR
ncbi:AraC family transcriptional regulator [Pontibacter sp. E15-1]|uniref:helix-turn-helix domain-containing protein n=1 Tax=Pontibacter sp. E15-1 TaxID=2919918 RepID=UPI001F503542|nr:AraC family transcriptional regulator [Pontibacter sp. E15-1]MCJ8163441.1 AraC family transcriptional regulator [Pontibacter sp. E15-1]